jgi:hypothetical protein
MADAGDGAPDSVSDEAINPNEFSLLLQRAATAADEAIAAGADSAIAAAVMTSCIVESPVGKSLPGLVPVDLDSLGKGGYGNLDRDHPHQQCQGSVEAGFADYSTCCAATALNLSDMKFAAAIAPD